MNILIISPFHWPASGGSEVYQRILSLSLSKKHKVSVAAQFAVDKKVDILEQTILHRKFSPYRDHNVNVYPLYNTRFSQMLLSPFLLHNFLLYRAKYIRRFSTKIKSFYSGVFYMGFVNSIKNVISGMDIVHSFDCGYIGYLGYWAAKRYNLPYVITPQAHPGHWNDQEFNINLFKKSDAVFCALDYEKKFHINNYISPAKVHVVGNVYEISKFYDGNSFRKKYKIRDGKIVLFIGVKRKYKGYEEILDSMDTVWREFPDTYFVFIGSNKGPLCEESTRIFSKYKSHKLLDLGVVSAEEKTSAIEASDIFCVPSTSESFGIVYLEAWKFGKPVIAANIPSSNELIENNKDGLIINQNPSEIAGAIIKLLKNDDLRKEMGLHGKRKVEQEYSLENTISKIEAVYTRVISNNRAKYMRNNGIIDGR